MIKPDNLSLIPRTYTKREPVFTRSPLTSVLTQSGSVAVIKYSAYGKKGLLQDHSPSLLEITVTAANLITFKIKSREQRTNVCMTELCSLSVPLVVYVF